MPGRVRLNEPLARHTTWRVGGPADFFIEPASSSELCASLQLLEQANVPWFVLGAGSNLLVRDGGFRGAAIHLKHFRQLLFGPKGVVKAGAGLALMNLIRETVQHGLGGLETLAGIPGTVGGGVVMNAGAGGKSIGDVVRLVTLVGSGGEESWGVEKLGFAYRRSALSGDKVVVEVQFHLKPGDVADLEKEIERCLAHRREAHSVGGANAGSVFKNPEGFQAWQLIDETGLRGAVEGDAQVSRRHANFIVNRGNATARDILTLMDRIVEMVHKRTGILLEPEVHVVGVDK